LGCIFEGWIRRNSVLYNYLNNGDGWPINKNLFSMFTYSLNDYNKMRNITRNQFKRIGLLGLMIWVTITAIGCNTMHGLGTDVEKAGEKIQKERD
jgi:predicted small secreted protein